MTNDAARTVRLEIASRLDMLDMVQTVLSPLAALVGFDDEATHYMSGGPARVRRANGDQARQTARTRRAGSTVDFVIDGPSSRWRCATRASGFDLSGVPDPVAEENLLQPDGPR
jgi:hypothetical protein